MTDPDGRRPEPRLLPSETVPVHGGPVARARARAIPEDFRVREVLGFAADGEGEHWLVLVRKRNRTTAEAMDALARLLGVERRAVGHAGLKDRRAVTEQWLSVHHPGPGILSPQPLGEDMEILLAARHRRKLRVGALLGNRFDLLLRDVDAPPAAVSRRLERIARLGVPNYFGPQRFGFEGRNLDKALALLEGRLRVRDRRVRGLLLSAARAELFNRVLARRVEDGIWDRAVPGDLMILDGRGSLFRAATESPGELERRLGLMAIHPSGPLPGRGGPAPGAVAAELEREALGTLPVLHERLVRHGIEGGRRALRLRVRELAWTFPGPGLVRIGMSLAAGAYATAVLAEAFRLDQE